MCLLRSDLNLVADQQNALKYEQNSKTGYD